MAAVVWSGSTRCEPGDSTSAEAAGRRDLGLPGRSRCCSGDGGNAGAHVVRPRARYRARVRARALAFVFPRHCRHLCLHRCALPCKRFFCSVGETRKALLGAHAPMRVRRARVRGPDASRLRSGVHSRIRSGPVRNVPLARTIQWLVGNGRPDGGAFPRRGRPPSGRNAWADGRLSGVASHGHWTACSGAACRSGT